mgnify:CR=1 FL=1
MDLILKGGWVVNETGRARADIGIAGDMIAAIAAPGVLDGAAETVDVTGLHLIPGAIDMHVHFREPGYAHKEDWEPADPLGRRDARQARARAQGLRRFRHLRPAGRGQHRRNPRPDRGGRERVQMLHGQHVRQPALAFDGRDARRVRGHRPIGAADFAARRNRVDHGVAPGAAGRGGVERPRTPPPSGTRCKAASWT